MDTDHDTKSCEDKWRVGDKTINYTKRGDKWVFNKQGIYFSLNIRQVEAMQKYTRWILNDEKPNGKQ